MSIWHTLVSGFVGPTGDNEVEVVSTKPDPPKIRLAVESDKVESNLGSISFNTRRVDGSGTHDEMAYVMGRLTADKKGGAVYIAAAPAKGANCQEVFYIDNGTAIFRVPVQFLAGCSGCGGGGSMPRYVALRAVANNRLVCAEAAGEQPLIANRDAIGPWETFEVVPIS